MLTIERYTPQYQKQWDKFVDESCNGTLFHKQKFLSYHIEGRFHDLSMFLLNDRNEIVSVFPAARMIDKMWSHPGASLGGPVIKQLGIEKMVEVVDTIDHYARTLCIKDVHMTLTPNLFHTGPVEGIEFALWYRGYRPDVYELSICVPLQLGQNFSKRRQRDLKKAMECGIEVSETYDMEPFWHILDNNLRVRHSTKPTHSLDELKKLQQLFPRDIRLFTATFEGKIVAGIVVFINNDTSFETFYIAQDYNYQQTRAMDAVINHVFNWGTQQGFEWMNFGITSEQRGHAINFGLAKFKEEFGGCDIVRRSYRKQL